MTTATNSIDGLKLSQQIGFNHDIIGQIFTDGIRNYEVIGINLTAKRFPVQYMNIQTGAKFSMSVKAFNECSIVAANQAK